MASEKNVQAVSKNQKQDFSFTKNHVFPVFRKSIIL